MKKLTLLMLAGGLLSLNSCVKDGPVGPQGPQGAPGYDGNANVIGESPFTVNAADWVYTTNVAGNTGSAYTVSFNDGNITTAVANHGLVMMYVAYSDGTWKNLPDIFNGTSFSFNFSAGGFDIYYTNVDGSVPPNPGSQVFRAVIIPSYLQQAHPHTNWHNYVEAMSVINSSMHTAPVSLNK